MMTMMMMAAATTTTTMIIFLESRKLGLLRLKCFYFYCRAVPGQNLFTVENWWLWILQAAFKSPHCEISNWIVLLPGSPEQFIKIRTFYAFFAQTL